MNVNLPKVPQNIIEKCRELWSLQKKLKQLLSKYGSYLEILRINPHNNEARKNILSLVNDINDVGKNQNILMKEWLGSVIQLSDKYSSHKSLLLENFRNALIRQLWNNGMEQCSEDVDQDIVKILFLNQTNLVPEQLDKSVGMTERNISNSITAGNISVISSEVDMFLPSGNKIDLLNLNMTQINDEKLAHKTVDIEPRCTRSSKTLLKRTNKEDEVQINTKSRKKAPLSSKVPNTCCSLCKKLIYVNERQMEENGKVICCTNCTNKFYSEASVNAHSSLNNDDPVTPSDVSSPNDTSQDTSHSNNS